MKKSVFLGTVAATTLVAGVAAAATLDDVKARDQLICGVNVGLTGFGAPDASGNYQGFDVAICKAVAAAVLGDPAKVKYVPTTGETRFTALASGEVDLLVRNSTWTYSRDTDLKFDFVGVNYYDGQGFMVSKKLGVKSAKELSGASVCIQAGTTTELNLADYFRANKMEYKAITYDSSDETVKAFEAGRCDMLTSDQSQLYALRIKLTDPNSAMVLPEVISKEPLGPVVRQGDDEWFNLVRWSLFAQINAEEAGVTMKNVDDMMKSADPNIRRILGVEGVKGEFLGVDDKWAYNIVKQVGNYGEMFERNVGQGSALKIARGQNALWNKGGIQYAPPIR